MKTTLSIIILNYKTHQVTLDCIKSIQSNYLSELINKKIEIVLVDNNSPDNSVEIFKKYLKKSHQGIRLFVNTKNSGFGGGCNYGANFATGTFLLFLNSDTQVLDRGLIRMADIFSTSNNLGIVGGKLLNENKTNQLTVGRFHDLLNVCVNLVGMEYRLLLSSPDVIKEVDWVTGGCLMIKKDIFNSIGGFDERIFLYLEDVELCYRVHKLKYNVLFFPFVNIIHKKGVSSNHSSMIINTYKGYLYFFKKHKSKFEYQIMKKLFQIKSFIYYLIGLISHNKFLETTYGEVFRMMS